MSIETAKQAYDRNLSSLEALNAQLQEKIAKLKTNVTNDKINWCDVGDIGNLVTLLDEALNPEEC